MCAQREGEGRKEAPQVVEREKIKTEEGRGGGDGGKEGGERGVVHLKKKEDKNETKEAAENGDG